MLIVYTGDYTAIKQTIEDKAKENNMPIHYSTDIFNDVKVSMGMFFKPSLIYFVFVPELFKDKETIEQFIALCDNKKTIVICIYETIDKRSSFYKTISKNIIEVQGNKTTKEETVFKQLGIKPADIKQYMQNIAESNVLDYDFKTISKILSKNDLEAFAKIPLNKIINVLYNVYYIGSKNKILAGKLINEVMQGKMTADIAIKYFLLYYIR